MPTSNRDMRVPSTSASNETCHEVLGDDLNELGCILLYLDG